MASAGGGAPATDEIPDVEMEVVGPPGEPGRVGSKRVRDAPSAKVSHGTAKKKPMLHPHDVDKHLKIAGKINHVHMNSDGASKVGGRYHYGMHGLDIQPDSISLSSSTGRCKKGKSCTFLDEKEGTGSAKVSLLGPAAGYGNHRGSGEGSQVQCLSDLKGPQFKDSESSLKNKLYRDLIHVYGEDDKKWADLAVRQNSPAPGVLQGMPCSIDDSLTKNPTPINELVQIPLGHEKNKKPHSSLAAQTYLDGKVTFPRGKLQSVADKGNIFSDSHVSRIYPEVNTLSSDHCYQSFGLSVSPDPLRRDKLSASGRIMENLPNAHQKHHLIHTSHSPHSSTGFINSGYAIPEHSFGSRNLPHLGIQSHHLFTSGFERIDLHKYVDADKGYLTSRPEFGTRSSPEPSILSPVSLSPIKDEVWVTSVPFVPSFSFPDSTTPSRSLYDPFVDSIDPPKVENANNPKSSNVSSQHVTTSNSLNCSDKLATDISAKGSKEPACLIASDRGRNSSLDDNNRVKDSDRKNVAASNSKTRDFRFHLAEHIKELMKPIWKEGNMSKDAHKLVVKKSVDKVLDSIVPSQIPTTEELIANYITSCGSKIEKLVKAYVDKYRAA